MAFVILKRAFDVLRKKPFVLWGIAVVYSIILIPTVSVAFGAVPGIAFCFVQLLSVGMAMVFYQGYHGENVKLVHLFDAFKDWDTIRRVLCGTLWASLWILLWSLIPIVGFILSVIRMYEYRLVPYILVYEPEVKPTEAIKASKERTYGYKGTMFWADVLTVVIPSCIFGFLVMLAGLTSRIAVLGALLMLIFILYTIAYILFLPLYAGLVQAAFYDEISHPSLMKDGTASVQCPQCGFRMNAGSQFCPNCGHVMSVSHPVPGQPAPNQPVPNQPATNQYAPNQYAAPVPPQPQYSEHTPVQHTDTVADNTILCPGCGTRNLSTAAFCKNCGTKL